MHWIAGSGEQRPMDAGGMNFRSQPAMHKPLLIPHRFQRARRHFTEQRREMWTTERAETCLRRIVIVRIPVVERCVGAGEHEKRLKVCLEQNVDVYPLAHVAAAANISRHWIEDVSGLVHTTLHAEPGGEVGHVIDARHGGPDPLVKLLRAEVAVLVKELRDEWPLEIAGRAPAKKRARRDGAPVRWSTEIAAVKRQVSGRSIGDCVRGIL